jgi:hypothetical protein
MPRNHFWERVNDLADTFDRQGKIGSERRTKMADHFLSLSEEEQFAAMHSLRTILRELPTVTQLVLSNKRLKHSRVQVA